MFKKLLFIGLLCIGVVVLLGTQATAGCINLPGGGTFCAKWIRGSMVANLTCDNTDLCQDATTEIRVFGTNPDTCELVGTLYCAPISQSGDSEEALEQTENNITECKNGQRNGHTKEREEGKGNGHDKGKGNGHTGTCLTEPGVVVPLSSDRLENDGEFDCVGEECTDLLSVEISGEAGQAACDDHFPGTVFVSFVPDEAYVQAETSAGEEGPTVITEFCELASDGINYDCEPADPDDIPNCLGAVVDMVFAVDTTGSMRDEIDNLKAEILDIINGLQCASESTDFNFAVVSYEDYPDFFDSRTEQCIPFGVSTYSAEYGTDDKPDAPFRINQVLTGDEDAVNTAVGALVLGNGSDGPQSYGRVFWELAQPDFPGSDIGFRPEAQKIVINFGDNVPHDTELRQGITSPPQLTLYDTGFDPGRDGEVCTEDDIDFQDDALAAMAGKIQLLHIDSSGNLNLAPYWEYWTGLTGGAFAAINADGTIPGGTDTLTDLILDLLGLPADPCE